MNATPDPSKHTAALARSGAALGAPQPLAQRLEAALQELTAAAGARRACLVQPGPPGEALTWLAGVELNAEQLSTDHLLQRQLQQFLSAAGQDTAGQVARLEQPAGLCASVTTGGEVLGALYLQEPGPDAQHLLLAAAALAALALQAESLQVELEKSKQARLKFISVVTHELRIPMTSIKGYTDLLRQGLVGPVNADQLDFLNVIRNNVERMSALVSDLSDLSRMETGRLQVKRETVLLGQCLEEALLSLRPSIEEKQQTMQVDFAPDLPAAQADPSRVVQVLAALLANAHRYSPAGTEIRVEAQAHEAALLVAVQDHGVGIGFQDQPKIFTPFFRSDDAAVREFSGWGLSLSVAKGLVEHMQGAIGFESVPGRGSRFWFTLPT